MKTRRILSALALLLFGGLVQAENDHLLQDAWKRAAAMAAKQAREIESLGKPRIIKKGAKPEIIIQGETITINGKKLAIGDTLEKWTEAIPGTPNCEAVKLGLGKKNISCRWELLGIEIATFEIDSVEKSPKFVGGMGIYINFEFDPYAGLVTTRPDGTPISPPQKTHPDHPFPGYLEIDGYGINSKTEFWEVLRSIDPKRNVYCGMRDCSHPEGLLGGREHLSFRLNNTSSRGNIYEISIWTTAPNPSITDQK
ncbi:MAG: hypothetical protein H6R15_2654 [Proteobacteria bacterium]|nr:hypothetical protein [Pseudomonadota bacterium]